MSGKVFRKIKKESDIKISESNTYYIRDFEEPSELIEYLQPHHPRWEHNGIYRRLAWRGQSESKWGLIASIFRSENREFLEDFHLHYRHMQLDQSWVELLILKVFLAESDDVGLIIPGDNAAMRSKYLEEPLKSSINWESTNNDLLTVVAALQHYGLPTRLLDWSYNPYIALYFAAIDVLKKCRYNKKLNPISDNLTNRMALWCLFAEIPVKELQEYNYRVFRPPTALNQNLIAQEGLFTIYPLKANQQLKLGKSDQKGIDFSKYLKSKDVENIRLVQLTLPQIRAAETIEILRKNRVHRGALFPSIEGVINHLKDILIY